MRVRLLWTALICWATLILWLSSMTPQELPDGAFLFWDKVNHLVAFAVGGWLAASALHLSRPGASVVGSLLGAVALIAAFGLLDETLQTLTPGRAGGNVMDWLADVTGAVAGALLTLPRLSRPRSEASSSATTTPATRDR